MCWSAAGVWDALQAGAYAEAQARVGLLLAAGDQLAIDRGSWVVASELLLEDGPPMAVFAAHTLPSELDQPYTKLVDGRWMDLVLRKLADYDLLAEKKKKLNFKRPGLPAGSETQNASSAAAKEKAEPKRKAKSKGKGKQSEGGAAAPLEAEPESK